MRVRAASVHAAGTLVRRHRPHLEAEAHVVAHVQMRIERVGLEHHRDAALGRRHLVHDPAADPEHAGGDVLEAGDHPQQRGLAAAGGADEDDELAVVDREIDAADDLDPAEMLLDVAEGETGHGKVRYAAGISA